MSWYEWLLFLHVLGALAMVAATDVFWAVMLAARRSERPTVLTPVFGPANVAVMAGSLLTLVFGVWLAIYLDGYELWDGWILGALVLWAISVETGRRGGEGLGRATSDTELAAALRDSRTMLLLTLSTVTLFLILVLMIWKPGA